MNRVPSTDANTLIFRQPHLGWGLLFFLPLFLAGAGFFCGWLSNVAWLAARDGRHAVAVVAAVLAIVAFAATANHFFGRIGCRANRSTRELTKEWGLFWLPWTSKTIKLEEGDEIRIRVAVGSGVTPTRIYYCDLVRANGKRVRLGLNEHNETPLVQMAAALSEALNLPAYNAAHEPPVRIFASPEQAKDIVADAVVQAMLRRSESNRSEF